MTERWGLGYFAEGARGSRGPTDEIGDRDKVQRSMTKAYLRVEGLVVDKSKAVDSPSKQLVAHLALRAADKDKTIGRRNGI
jgi:hypothetical protein